MTWTFYNALGQEKRAMAPPPSSEYAFVQALAGGAAVNVGAQTLNAWFAYPLAQGVPRTSTPTGAFVINADGSLTVRDAGIYDIEANINATLQWTTASARLVAGIGVGATPAAAAANIVSRQDDLSGASNAYPSTGQAGAVTLAAGDKVWALGYGQTNAGSAAVTQFSITRVGSGPQGPRGGSKWWTSGVTYSGILVNDPADVVAPIQGDIFLYPDSGDTFSFDGSVWVYSGPLPVGGVEPSAFGLPPSSSVVDGQVVHMQDSTMSSVGAVWSFAYSSFGNRWEYIGGTPYYLENDAIFSTVAPHTTYQDVGMGFTLPYAGTYIVELNGLVTTAAVAGNAAILSVRFGGTAANDAWGAIFGNAGATAANTSIFSRVKLALTGTQLDPQVQLRSNTANVVSVQRKRFACTPVFLNGV